MQAIKCFLPRAGVVPLLVNTWLFLGHHDIITFRSTLMTWLPTKQKYWWTKNQSIKCWEYFCSSSPPFSQFPPPHFAITGIQPSRMRCWESCCSSSSSATFSPTQLGVPKQLVDLESFLGGLEVLYWWAVGVLYVFVVVCFFVFFVLQINFRRSEGSSFLKQRKKF